MAKISKKISQEDENKEPQKQEQYTGGIKRKVKTEDDEQNVANKDGEEVKKNSGTENPLTPEEIAHWFISFFGEEIFDHVKENPNFSLPFTEGNISTEQWLNKALKTVFLFEDIQKIGLAIKIKYFQAISAVEESKQFQKDYKRMKNEFEELEEDLDRAKSKRNKLEKEMRSSLPAEGIIEAIFGKDEKASVINQSLKDAMSNPGDELKEFVLAFIRGWLYLKQEMKKFTDDEKANIDIAQHAIRELLKNISGHFIPERRAILDQVAEYISGFFKEYIFISPEQSLQIDPSMHNAKGLGGSRVKEGISFAVLRKENKQTYQYADIKVQ